MCDQIFDLLLRNNYIRILDRNVEPSIHGRMYCKLHDSFKHNFEDCNMFCQIVKSAIEKGRLKFVETPRDDQSILIGRDGKKFLHHLLKADSLNDEKVKTVNDGIKFQVNKFFKSTMKIFLKEGIPSRLHRRRQVLGAASESNDR